MEIPHYVVILSPLNKTIVASFKNDLSAELLRTVILEVISLGMESNTYKRIFDFTEVPNMSQTMHDLIGSFSPETLQFITNAKIAVVVNEPDADNEQLISLFKVYISTAISEYRLFTSQEDAFTWLATV